MSSLAPVPLLLLTLATAALLVALCFFTHLAVMERLSRRVYRPQNFTAHPVRLVLFTLFAAHLLEVFFYAIVLWLFDWAGLGTLAGNVDRSSGGLVDHFYVSIASYTTLGVDDIVPQGALRLLVGIEALNGLVLVAWSASFTYLVMERCWGTGRMNDETRD